MRARDNSCFVALCNAVGGQDELIFDGHSVVIDDEGEVVARAAGFEEELLVVDVDPVAAIGRRLRDVRRRALARERAAVDGGRRSSSRRRARRRRRGAEASRPSARRPRADAACARARAARLRDEERLRRRRDRHLRRHRLGARPPRSRVEALGAERVHGVSMPSRYSSEATRGDAQRLADVARLRLPRDRRSSRWSRRSPALAPAFAGREADLTEENLQARIRGTMLMALSNKFGWLVIATGNKSELSVGYSTLYGDLAGGFALIKDVYKTDVFRLSRRLNERAGRELIPASIIERAPSAELRDDQLDEDSLPPYPKLDRVLEAYVELDRSREELVQDGFDPEVVERALAMIDRAEYKRRQAPPGVKLRPKAFGRDRRTPITNRWPG